MSEYELELRQCKAAFEIIKLLDKQKAIEVATTCATFYKVFENVQAAVQTIKSHAYLELSNFFSDDKELNDFLRSFYTSENPDLLVESLREKFKETTNEN